MSLARFGRKLIGKFQKVPVRVRNHAKIAPDMPAVARRFHQTVIFFGFRADFLNRLQIRQAEGEGRQDGLRPRHGLQMSLLREDEKGGVRVFRKTHPDPPLAVPVPLVGNRAHTQVFAVKVDGKVRILDLEKDMVPFGIVGYEFQRQGVNLSVAMLT